MKKNVCGIKIKKPRANADAMALFGSGKRSFFATYKDMSIDGKIAQSSIWIININYKIRVYPCRDFKDLRGRKKYLVME